MESKKEKLKLAICVFGHGGSIQTWATGTEQNIVLATKAAKKAKRDYKIKKDFIMPVNIFDITDSERWAYDGHTIVNPDIVDKESEEYKQGKRYYNPYAGAKRLPYIETLDVVL